jgi:hypothetical protein
MDGMLVLALPLDVARIVASRHRGWCVFIDVSCMVCALIRGSSCFHVPRFLDLPVTVEGEFESLKLKKLLSMISSLEPVRGHSVSTMAASAAGVAKAGAAAAAAASSDIVPKLRYLSAWFCPYAHRATLALEHHQGRVE